MEDLDVDLQALKRRQKQERIRRRREHYYEKDRCVDERHQRRRRQNRSDELPPRCSNTTITKTSTTSMDKTTMAKETQTSSISTPTPTPPLVTYGAATNEEKTTKNTKKYERKIRTNELGDGNLKMTSTSVINESETRRSRLQRIREERREEERTLRASQLIQEHLGRKHFEELCGGGGSSIVGGDGGTTSDSSDNYNKKNKKNHNNKFNSNCRLLPSQQTNASPSGGISPLTQSPSIIEKSCSSKRYNIDGNTIHDDISKTGSTPELFERTEHPDDNTGWHEPHSQLNLPTTTSNRKTTSKRCDTKNRALSSTTATATTSLMKRSKKQQIRATTKMTLCNRGRLAIHQLDGDTSKEDYTNNKNPNDANDDNDDDQGTKQLITSSFYTYSQGEKEKEEEGTKRKARIKDDDDQGYDGITTKPRVLFAELPKTIARVGVNVGFGCGDGDGDSSSEEDLFAARAYIERQKGTMPGSSSTTGEGGDGDGDDGMGTTSNTHSNNKRPSSSSSTSRWHVSRGKLGTTLGRTNDGTNDGTHDGVSSSSEEEDLYLSARKIRQQKQKRSPPKRLASHNNDIDEMVELRRFDQKPRNSDDSISPFFPVRGVGSAGTSRGDTRKAKDEEDDLWGDDSSFCFI